MKPMLFYFQWFPTPVQKHPPPPFHLQPVILVLVSSPWTKVFISSLVSSIAIVIHSCFFSYPLSRQYIIQHIHFWLKIYNFTVTLYSLFLRSLIHWLHIYHCLKVVKLDKFNLSPFFFLLFKIFLLTHWEFIHLLTHSLTCLLVSACWSPFAHKPLCQGSRLSIHTMSFFGLIAHLLLVLNNIHCLDVPQLIYPLTYWKTRWQLWIKLPWTLVCRFCVDICFQLIWINIKECDL